MTGTYLLRVGAVGLSRLGKNKPSTLKQAVRHNRRQIQAERGATHHGSIDPARTHLNEFIAGPADPDEVVLSAKARMAASGVAKLRRDFTQAVEVVFSLSPDTTVNIVDFFRRCVIWAGDQFGVDNILTADIHRDQAAPHCHVLVLPLVNGRMVGSKLIDRPATAKLHTAFASVAKEFGLMPPPANLSGASRLNGTQMVLARLESTQDAILRSALWDTTRDAIKANPAPYMAALGINRDVVKPKAALRTMAQIFTSPGRGPKVEQQKPIGLEHNSSRNRTLPCVGFDSQEPLMAATKGTSLTDCNRAAPRRYHSADSYRSYRQSAQAPMDCMV